MIASQFINQCTACQAPALERRDDALQCGSCGARFEITEGVYAFMRDIDDYSENYDQICQDDLLHPKTPDVVKGIFTELVLERAKGAVCDVGCGDGHVITRIKSAERFAVDIAHSYLKRLPSEISRVWCRAENLPFASSSFDTLVCTDVLEHVLDAEVLAAELTRIIKPGGRLLLAVPFEQDLSVYELPEYKAKYAKYKYVHLRSVDDAMIAALFSKFDIAFDHLITEGMPLMEFNPYPIKFFELVRR